MKYSVKNITKKTQKYSYMIKNNPKENSKLYLYNLATINPAS